MRNKKIYLLLFSIFFFKILYSQTLYNKDGFSLYYTANIYNTVSVEGTYYYDQYEVKVYFKNASGRVIFSPSILKVEWDQSELLRAVRKFYTYEYDNATNTKTKYMRDSFPQSAHNVTFGFPDGKRMHYNQPAPYNSGDMFRAADYHEYLMLDGQIDSCKLYILVEHGQALPTPKWNMPSIKYKDNFKKAYLSGNENSSCGCTGKYKPRGKRGDKPKGMKENENAKKNDKIGKNDIDIKKAEKPFRSKEVLKTLILENLRKFTDKEKHTEKRVDNIIDKFNITDLSIEIINDELVITWTSDNYCIDEKGSYCVHLIPKLYKSIVSLKVIQFVSNYGGSINYHMAWDIQKKYEENRTYQKNCKEYLIDLKRYNTGENPQFTDDCKFINSYFIPEIKYNQGEDKINFKELNQAFMDLYKLLNNK